MPPVTWFDIFTSWVFVGINGTMLTFYNINHTEAKQRRYMIGSGRVNCDGAAHAVANHHDGRRGVSIERLHYFANIPLEGQNAKKNSLYCNISVPFAFGSSVRNKGPVLQNYQYWFVQYAECM